MINLLICLIVYNCLVFFLYGYDKKCAQKGKWRVSEKTLLLCAALGGGCGAFFGMQFFRHKTKHLRFKLLVPLFLIIQIGMALYFCLK